LGEKRGLDDHRLSPIEARGGQRSTSVLIERLWLHLRDNRLSHCVFQTTGEIVDTCCDAWNWLLGQTGRIQSLRFYPWLERVSD
jgi:hypothetical protein